MNPDEIQLLVCGIAIGMQGASIVHMVSSAREARRALAASAAARKRAAGDRFLNSLELYQVQQRYGLVP